MSEGGKISRRRVIDVEWCNECTTNVSFSLEFFYGEVECCKLLLLNLSGVWYVVTF